MKARIISLIMLSCCVCIGLSGCQLFQPYRPITEQGSALNANSPSKLHKGMTAAQVEKALGQPVLVNMLDKNQISYVYTVMPWARDMTTHHLTIYMKNGRVTSWTTDLAS